MSQVLSCQRLKRYCTRYNLCHNILKKYIKGKVAVIMRVPIIENYSKELSFVTMQIARPLPVEREFMILNDKDRFKLVKTVEQKVRGSLEYKEYIKFLKDEIDMTSCAFFNNINRDETPRVKFEIHHEPFTLFDITNAVVGEFIENDKPANPLVIAEEVMKLHYQNLVGLIPLSNTCHGLVHDGRLMVPLQCVYGDFLGFVDKYYEYIPDDVREMLNEKIAMSKEIKQVDTSILNKKYVYLEVDGFTLPQKVE